MNSVTSSFINYVSNVTPTGVINYSVDAVKNNLLTPWGALSWGSLACIQLMGTEEEKANHKKVSSLFLTSTLAAGLIVGVIGLALEIQEPAPDLNNALKWTWLLARGGYQCYSVINVGATALLAANTIAGKLQQQANALEKART
jgi:hypothetical protein